MRYEGRTFENEPLVLDDHEFVDCTFKECELSYNGGVISLAGGTRFVRSSIALAGSAAQTHRLMMALQTGRPDTLAESARIRIDDAWI